MKQFAGAYLKPNIAISEKFESKDFFEIEFWEKVKTEWGIIVVSINHKSETNLRSENNPKHKFSLDQDIFISKDGLISTQVPEGLEDTEEVISVLSSHISSFVGTLNLGGLFLYSISECNLFEVINKNGFSSWNGGFGNLFINNANTRNNNRYRVPIDNEALRSSGGKHKKILFEFCTPILRKPNELKDCYEIGRSIKEALKFPSDALIMELDALKAFTLYEFNSALLHGWAFIEMVIDRIWADQILNQAESKRKKRLKDNRTYSSSVKIEILFQSGFIDDDLYNYLNHLRKLRNDLIHKTIGVRKQDIELMFPITNELIKLLTGHFSKIYRQGGVIPGGWIKNSAV